MRKVANPVIIKKAKQCSLQWYFPVQVACLGSVMAVGHLGTEGHTLKELMSPQGMSDSIFAHACTSLFPFITTANAHNVHTDGSRATRLLIQSYPNSKLKEKIEI